MVTAFLVVGGETSICSNAWQREISSYRAHALLDTMPLIGYSFAACNRCIQRLIIRRRFYSSFPTLFKFRSVVLFYFIFSEFLSCISVTFSIGISKTVSSFEDPNDWSQKRKS